MRYGRENRNEYRRDDFRQKSFAPVKVGDEIVVKIEAVGEKGDGIAKKEGFVLFVPATKVGDEVTVKIIRVLQKVGFAEVISQSTKSDEQSESGNSEEDSNQMGESQEDQSKGSEEEDYSVQNTENFGEDEQ